ncbi:G-protein coupled receptor 176-like [Apteryx rowi]|uniref:G-protein coupled receptor 176-like n=1 Tax=Apteryx rowi TaxID=308060 RepID=UPI000E1E120F|nr:G-protein coupled receptor 176-like [Apteryx rowi]
MGHNRSWISKNQSEHALYQVVTRAVEIRNVSAAQIAWNKRNGSGIGALENGEYSGEQTYRHFTIAVQVVIFIGSLLGPMIGRVLIRKSLLACDGRVKS